ncbi:MAG: methyltransferase domain-containing protein [Candidatus Nealsonbacteria bacterium]|nr:methyltransferase domain-containing protein [Candidatus Nealsonbacteria bacterium]
MDQWDKIYKERAGSYKYYNIFKPHENLRIVGDFFERKKVDKILDIGCGVGRNLIPLAKRGFEISGIDIAREGILILEKELKKRGLDAELRIGNVFKTLPYQNNDFDAIISVQVLQHGSLNQIKKAISEIERVLKPGGYIFITLCGRYSKGKVRYCIVKTARKVAPRTYVPTKGEEVGLKHFIYNKELIKKHYKNFKFIKFWKDSKDYYCFIGKHN